MHGLVQCVDLTVHVCACVRKTEGWPVTTPHTHPFTYTHWSFFKLSLTLFFCFSVSNTKIINWSTSCSFLVLMTLHFMVQSDAESWWVNCLMAWSVAGFVFVFRAAALHSLTRQPLFYRCFSHITMVKPAKHFSVTAPLLFCSVTSLFCVRSVLLYSVSVLLFLHLLFRCTASPAAAGGIPGQASACWGPAATTLHPEGHRYLPEQPVPGSHRYNSLSLIYNIFIYPQQDCRRWFLVKKQSLILG